MPYKSKEQATEASKERMRRHRLRPNVTPKDVTPKALRPVTPKVPITGGAKTIYVTAEKAARLLLICQSLDRQSQGLRGKENLLDLVRYGCSGPTMSGVKESLCH